MCPLCPTMLARAKCPHRLSDTVYCRFSVWLYLCPVFKIHKQTYADIITLDCRCARHIALCVISAQNTRQGSVVSILITFSDSSSFIDSVYDLAYLLHVDIFSKNYSLTIVNCKSYLLVNLSAFRIVCVYG